MSLVGKPAPDFSLQAYHNGEIMEISLSDYRGKWVCLLFYGLDFTFVCPTPRC
jgi:alkyl hydroperoxide reductase subunit AhpC